MAQDEQQYSGTLRITNPSTLDKWKSNGDYQKLIDKGYLYGNGCGRFRLSLCTCSKCRRKIKST